MGGKVPPVPVVEPPVLPPVLPPAPPVVPPPAPGPEPPFPLVLVPEEVEDCSALQPWNMDHATTAMTTGIANRAILMASPLSSKVGLLPTPSKWRADERNAQRLSLAAEKLSYFVQPM
jgi:hypothetical protein